MSRPTLKQIWLPAVLLIGGLFVFWIVPLLSGPPKVELKIVPETGGTAKKP